ncbi:ShlB/FhaC/HecB family hemolysin secretion/activation protein [Sphingosinicellaceae bacterium]|nr:ShlB/FhaC/HecB family hemolysin secretion/activation protein [Sphingosinicellaceae bacterium]
MIHRISLLAPVARAVLLVTAGLAAPVLAQSAAPVPPAPPAAVAAATFDVLAIAVSGNTVLPPAEVEALVYPSMGPGKTATDIEVARAALQAAFEKRGYATVSVIIPEQSVDSGTIQLEVQAQAIGTVTVAGGKRTTADWVLKRAPSLAAGTVPDFTAVQRDIVGLNRSADRKVSPAVTAGVAPGTVDVVLNVADKLPLHGTLEVNNFSSVATSDLRVAASLRYDDLWGRGDSISVSAQTAPRRSKDGTVVSGNYLARVGGIQLMAYGVYSDSDIAVVGGTSVIGRGTIFGGRAIVPLSQSAGFYQSLTAGLDWKKFKEDVRLGADRDSAPIEYFPVTVGWRGDWTGDRVQSNAGLTTVFGVRGAGDDAVRFDYKRYGAKPNFFIVKAELGQTRTLGDFEVYAHAGAQWSPDPLISNEGFSLGGMESVRGLYESEALGDWGIAAQSELRLPELSSLFGTAGGAGKPVGSLRVVLFADGGTAGIHRPLAGQERRWTLGSTGVGVRFKVFNYLNGAGDFGTPLVDGPDSRSGSLFARFRIWGEF